MDTEFRYMAQLMFERTVYKQTGQAYEDFFCSIMEEADPLFKRVKAHGNIGDRKNDGFCKQSGTYYQVYAPNDLLNKKTEKDALKKLEEDFEALYEYWNDKFPIHSFYFVLNDKYNGVPPPLYEKLNFIEKLPTYKHINFNFFSSKDLERTLMNLDEGQITQLLGCVPKVTFDILDGIALTDVINYLLQLESPFQYNEIMAAPDFEDKIAINGISKEVANLLNSRSCHCIYLENYFHENRNVRSQLQMKLIKLYQQSKEEIPDTLENYADKRFFYILDTASTTRTKPIQEAILTIMTFYFEACDIFEPPIG